MRKFDLVLFNGKVHLLGDKVEGYQAGYKALNLDDASQAGLRKMRYTHTFISVRDFDKCQFVRRTTKAEREEMFLPESYC